MKKVAAHKSHNVKGLPVSSSGWDLALTFTSFWLIFGVFIDGWAHNHIIETIESFFTIWHLVLYTGFFACAGVIGLRWILNVRKGYEWRKALPVGWGVGMVGVFVFLAAGMGDMIWHIVFGVEANVDALLSPTHLILTLGGVLIISSPMRSYWLRKDGVDLNKMKNWMPMAVCLGLTFAVLSFMEQFNHPLKQTWAATSWYPRAVNQELSDYYGQAMGITGILFQTVVMMGVVLLAAKKRRLPTGTFFVMMTLAGLGMSALEDQYLLVPVSFIAGVAMDILYTVFQPFQQKRGSELSEQLRVRMFAFAVPFVFYLCYFLALMANEPLWWSVHFWTGAIVLSGLTGLMMSLVVEPTKNA
ncbi:hypothetical protein IT413_01270 [Candidatus Peregrinibacteria bacterium]|nr:hypothetical protein [Candidatus Peregrinibacteria bacterium]